MAGAKIEAELEALDAFYEVDVASSATLGSHECDWDVTFSTTAGNLDQLSISVSRDAAGPEDGPSSSAQAGDDTMTVATTTEGRTDIVQSELEALSTIGRVTVSVESAGVKDDGSEGIEWLEKRRTGTCLYRVTFDTNAGDLPMIAICGDPNCAVNHRSNVDGQGVQNFQRGVFSLPYDNKNSTANVTLVQKSTSVAVSGDFALEFRGQRTGYLPYTSSAYAVEAALEALSTIGSVAVSRTAPDENGGATWSITFLTELGDVPMLTADDLDTCLETTLQPGNSLVASGYVLYSSATHLFMTLGAGTYGFTYDEHIGEFVLTHPCVEIPKRGKIYSCNEANRPYWDKPLQDYFEGLSTGTGESKTQYTSRYIGSMVGDVHRTLLYGGVFGYPADAKNKNGKLRLLYEAAPMAFLVEQAGGAATTGRGRIMDIEPTNVHQRVPCMLGSVDDVNELLGHYSKTSPSEDIYQP